MHLSIIIEYKNTVAPNRALNLHTPPICKTETTLAQNTRRRLAQFNANKSSFLHTYMNKMSPATHPSPLCSLYNWQQHDSSHLFNCQYIQSPLGGGDDGCTIYSFICLTTGAIEQQPCCFASMLLLYAPPKVISVQCQCYSVSLEVHFYPLIYRQAFIGFSCCFGGLSYSLYFCLLSLLQHALSQRFRGS